MTYADLPPEQPQPPVTQPDQQYYDQQQYDQQQQEQQQYYDQQQYQQPQQRSQVMGEDHFVESHGAPPIIISESKPIYIVRDPVTGQEIVLAEPPQSSWFYVNPDGSRTPTPPDMVPKYPPAQSSSQPIVSNSNIPMMVSTNAQPIPLPSSFALSSPISSYVVQSGTVIPSVMRSVSVRPQQYVMSSSILRVPLPTTQYIVPSNSRLPAPAPLPFPSSYQLSRQYQPTPFVMANRSLPYSITRASNKSLVM